MVTHPKWVLFDKNPVVKEELFFRSSLAIHNGFLLPETPNSLQIVMDTDISKESLRLQGRKVVILLYKTIFPAGRIPLDIHKHL